MRMAETAPGIDFAEASTSLGIHDNEDRQTVGGATYPSHSPVLYSDKEAKSGFEKEPLIVGTPTAFGHDDRADRAVDETTYPAHGSVVFPCREPKPFPGNESQNLGPPTTTPDNEDKQTPDGNRVTYPTQDSSVFPVKEPKSFLENESLSASSPATLGNVIEDNEERQVDEAFDPLHTSAVFPSREPKPILENESQDFGTQPPMSKLKTSSPTVSTGKCLLTSCYDTTPTANLDSPSPLSQSTTSSVLGKGIPSPPQSDTSSAANSTNTETISQSSQIGALDTGKASLLSQSNTITVANTQSDSKLVGKTSIMSQSDQSSTSTANTAISLPLSQCDTSGTGEHGAPSHVSQSNTNSPMDTNLFICSMCDQTFDSSDRIQSHMMSHAEEIENPPLSSSTLIQDIKEEIQSDTEQSTRRKYPCSVCFKIFCSKYNLDVHMRTHTGERPYECSICGKTFGSSSNCKKHMKTHKAKGREEIKEDVEFMKLVKVHTGERPFECVECGKRYTCKSDAQKHLRVHTGRKPYNCSFCTKVFSCSSNLYTHMRRKHKDQGTSAAFQDGSGDNMAAGLDFRPGCIVDESRVETRKVYSCMDCEKEFESKVQYDDHMKAHRTLGVFKKGAPGIYFCTMCTESFLCFDNLMKHMMDHKRGGRLLTCVECGDNFTSAVDLSIHRRFNCGEAMLLDLSAPGHSKAKFCDSDVEAGGYGETSYNRMAGTDAAGQIDNQAKDLSMFYPGDVIQKCGTGDIASSETGRSSRDSCGNRQSVVAGESSCPQEDGTKDGTTSSLVQVEEKEGGSDQGSDDATSDKLIRPVLKGEGDYVSEIVENYSSVFARNHNGSVDLSLSSPGNDIGRVHKTEYEGDDEMDLSTVKVKQEQEEDTSDMKGNYRCMFCNATFDCYDSLSEHAKLHTGDETCQCTLCRSGYCCSSNMRLDGNKDGFLCEVGETAYECFMCMITFDSRKPYIEHMRIHTKEKSFICYLCGKNFPRMKNLRQHFITHTNERAFSCPECGKSFMRKVNLTNHMRIHTGDQPHKCSVCFKGYNSKYDLDLHMRSHTGEKPCPCPDCGKSFASNGHLHKHMKVHSQEESQFRCSVCFKTFCSNTSLGRHFMIHTGESPFECDVCGKSFRRQIRLKYHMRIHTGEQPYKCSVCFKNYNSKYQMESHMRTHTGEKPFQCSVCEKAFQRRTSLNKHEQTHLENCV